MNGTRVPSVALASEAYVPVGFLEGLSHQGAPAGETYERVRALVDRVRLVNAGLPVERVVVTAFASGLHVALELRVRDRDPPHGPILLVNAKKHSWEVVEMFLKDGERTFLRYVFQLHLTEAVSHEVDEAIRFDGERPFDPHVLREVASPRDGA